MSNISGGEALQDTSEGMGEDKVITEDGVDELDEGIHQVNVQGIGPGEDESRRLKDLQADVRNQDDLERDIGRQADKLLVEQADERDLARLEKTRSQREKLASQIRRLRERLSQPIGHSARVRLRVDIEKFQSQVEELEADLEQIQERIDQRRQHENRSTGDISGTGRMPNESQRDYLIRTGKITPFSKIGVRSIARSTSNLQDALLDAEEEREEEDFNEEVANHEPVSHRNLVLPGFGEAESSEVSSTDDQEPQHPRKRRRFDKDKKIEAERQDAEKKVVLDESRVQDTSPTESNSDAAFIPKMDENALEETPLDADGLSSDYDDDPLQDTTPAQRKGGAKKKKTSAVDEYVEDLRGVDDGNERLYQSRLQKWAQRRREARRRVKKKQKASGEGAADISLEAEEQPEENAEPDDEDHPMASEDDEWYLPHPRITDTEFEGGLRIPGDIYPFLFDYQKTGVQWLGELYSQQVGGIIGDEMGLGKTIQMIAFLAGLHYSKKLLKPILVVCPATVMKQWVNEFHRWWPPFRVSILHTSGSGMIDLRRESSREDELSSQMWEPDVTKPHTQGQKAAKKVVNRVLEEGHVLVTTYSGLQTYARLLIPVDWEYTILDEGHKIRNPNTAITIYCKELRTPNRIILSGTPMQNNLTELWSLFDFVFPMRLGTLVNFRTQFEFPIRQGGYANASNLQVQTAMKCAETLKDAISPYLLQRFKHDVAADLPKKSEQVLFCKLTKLQRSAYETFLGSEEMKSIMNGRRQVLYGVDILRKICNHPDLQEHKTLSLKSSYNYGDAKKSGKMQVVGSLIELWKDTGHKTLLFAQHRIMLDILEKFIKSLTGFNYRRMDGNTPIQSRQDMVDEFNKNPDIHVFLLTTKVGGLGINLTGADRVIIYDPDWNPSTDVQARERAWRLGQKREVTIYRLMTAGTIEEKIYHRQIFKQFLTNKILKDPKQRQTFQMKDLHDLFSLGDDSAGPTETSEIFKDAEIKYNKQSIDSLPLGNVANGGRITPVSGSVEQGVDKDIRSVAGVSSVQAFHDPTAEESQPSTDSTNTNSEARVLSSIFTHSDIHSSVSHDQIINGKKVITADPKSIEVEAKKVAAEAARELKRAGELARTVPIGTPTWTGQFGVAGRPQETTAARAFASGRGARAGPSSSSILAGLQNRQGVTAMSNGGGGLLSASSSGTSTPRPGTPSSAAAPRAKDFMKLIRDYLTTHGGSVHTQMLIDHFNRFCTSPRATAEFKESLKVIATLERGPGSRGRGRWVLKGEYRK